MAWTVRFTDTDSTAADLGIMPEDEAKSVLDGVRQHVDPHAVLVDLTAELAAHLPVGSRIRHTTVDRAGTVAVDDTATPPSAYLVRSQYSLVCVRWDGRPGPEWFNVKFIEPAER